MSENITKENLLIVFVKNIRLGKVKTRLAKTIGNQKAFEIYKELVSVTEIATENTNATKHIYFSDAVVDTKWQHHFCTVQNGENLGERMLNAFKDGFSKGYKNIILIGSDLPNISGKIINSGFDNLTKNDVIFGPAEDGGYYLIGMKKPHSFIFENKPWSTETLLKETLAEIETKSLQVGLLETLNDIDTYEDLVASSFYKNNKHIQDIIHRNE